MSTVPVDTVLSQPGAGLRRLGVVLAYLGLGALVMSPLLWIAVPVLIDYPNHLARIWLAVHADNAPGINYVVRWQWMPNLAMELIVPMLARAMTVERAGWLFVAVAMLLPVIGTMTLRRALSGRAGLWPLAAFLFVYNAVLQWGFVNFLFGMGVALLLFSGWIGSARWPVWLRICVFAPAVAILFILHLFAFGIYGLMVAAYEVGDWMRRVPGSLHAGAMRILLLGQLIPACALWVYWAESGGPRHTVYGGFTDKLFALSAPMGFGDLGLSIGILSLPLFFLAWKLRILRIVSGMGWPIAALVVAAIAMPNWVLGSWAADIRIPATLPFVLIAASQPAPMARWLRAGIMAMAFTFLSARVFGLTVSWIDLNHQYSEFRGALRTVPQGARLLVVHAGLSGKRPVPGIPVLLATRLHTEYLHMPMLAIIDRDAFVPYLFTGWTTIAPAPRNADRSVTQGLPLTPAELRDALRPERRAETLAARDILGAAPYWLDWPEKFDFVVWIDFGQKPDDLPAQLREFRNGGFFHIYRIVGR